MKTKYVLGFAFTEDMQDMLLIRKVRPDWQAGKLNAIGGHVEPGEWYSEAMIREFKEETDVKTFPCDWTWFADASFPNAELTLFWMSHNKIRDYETMTDESVVLVPVKHIVDHTNIELVETVSLWTSLAIASKVSSLKPLELIYE